MLEFLELSWYLFAGISWITYAMISLAAAGVIYLQHTRDSKKLLSEKVQTYKMVFPLTLIVCGFGVYGISYDAGVMGEQNMQAYQEKSCEGSENNDCDQLRKKMRWLIEFGYSLNEASL